MRRGGLLLTLAIGMGLGAAAPAQGAVTIGSSLATDPMFNDAGCNQPCTTINLALPAAAQAPGGLTAPTDGVVTSWRARANVGNSIRLRILRPVVATTFTGAGTSAPGSWATGISPLFPTSLAVKAGDFIGLESRNANLILSNTATATSAFWNMTDVLPDGTSRAANGTGTNREVNVQATIEPDVDCDKLGDETQEGIIRQGCMVQVLSGAAVKGTLTLQVRCPLVTQNCDNNTLTLATSTPVKLGKAKGKGKSKATASAKKKKKKKKKKAKVIPIGTLATSVPAGQTLAVPLKLKGNANALFRQRRSVRVNATITGSGKTLTEPFTATAPKPKKKKKKKKKKK